MKEIGGFFELELRDGKEYYNDLISLSSGRNALLYLFQAKNISKVYIPYYCCDAFIEPIDKMNIMYEFYNIDSNFHPIFDKIIKKNEYFIYINYFGINQNNCKKLRTKYDNLIIDNSQAFFSKPLSNIDSFYSPRKFFGVPDGGYLNTNIKINKNIPRSYSYDRCKHLLKRADINANSSYNLYKKNEKKLDNQPIKKMSELTKKILSSINYREIKLKREENFKKLHSYFNNLNELKFDSENINSPMIYPLLIKNKNVKRKLIDKKIYIPTYWKEALNRTKKTDFGNYLTNQLIPLPIDQRYNIDDIKRIIDEVSKLI